MRDDVINHQLWVARGKSHRGKSKAKEMTVKALAGLLDTPSVDATITYPEYMGLGKTKEGRSIQADKKAAGGFIVAGKFKNGSRKLGDMVGRSALQFDLDYATPEQVKYILDGYAEINEWAYLWHTTRSHCPEKPRVRILVPLARMVKGDEIEALTRYVALTLADDPEEAIEVPDLVSFRPNQIMYLPTVSRNQEYLCGNNFDAPILDPDEFLAQYPDWQDLSKLPRQADEKEVRGFTGSTKMEDPTQKDGIVGAFCRAYGAEEAIAEFLSDIYEPGESSGSDVRYTYVPGSAYNGVVIYDDMFIHSHHGTDPAEGQHNQFDSVRIHNFGHLDEGAHGNTSPGNMPSFKAMREWAEKLDRVKKERAAYFAVDVDEFDDLDEERGGTEPSIDDLLSTEDEGEESDNATRAKKRKADQPNSTWHERLIFDKRDNVAKRRYNAALIVDNDERIAPALAYNELAAAPYIRKPLKFSRIPECRHAPILDPEVGRAWADVDTAALSVALAAPVAQNGYNCDFSVSDLETAMLLAAQKRRYNPFLDMVHKVEWDGVERLGTTFARFLGAPDTAYTRELEISFFVAAIARQYEPGHPYHLVPIFGGKQGGGKTGFLKAIAFESRFYGELSGDFSNTQKMVESTQGSVITELPELKGTHRGDLAAIKQHFSTETDRIRLAYRRNPEDFPRMNVTAGTTNEFEFLRDDENRRFCPVPVTVDRDKLVDFPALEALVPQIWAEAENRYLAMRRAQPKGHLALGFVSLEAKAEALERQTLARETLAHEPVAEVVGEWLETPLSAAAVAGGEEVDEFEGDADEARFLRCYVTVTMIRKMMDKDPIIRDLKSNADKVISNALRDMPGWKPLGKCRRLGRQVRWYVRTGFDRNEEFLPEGTIRGIGAVPEDIDNMDDDFQPLLE